MFRSLVSSLLLGFHHRTLASKTEERLFYSADLLIASRRGTSEADRIIIVKSARTMTLMSRGKVLKTYKVALGTQPAGAKDRAGDRKTPEGNYVVDSKNEKSQFYRALHISYPNPADRARS
jgi:murein L,D-transpeptidase YafK